MQKHAIHGLEIVAFATALDDLQVPSIVPPVFLVREGGRDWALFPPFEIRGESIFDGTVAPLEEVDQFVKQGRITRLERPVKAQADHELWIDEDMQPRYGPCGAVEAKLREYARGKLAAAREHLKRREWDDAYLCAGRALNADDRMNEPLFIHAAIHRLRGDTDLEEETKATALEAGVTEQGYDLEVDALTHVHRDSSPCKGVAKKPALACA